MKSNLDVYAIQDNKEELRIPLSKVKKDSSGNILYINCRCKFKIGTERIFSKLFNSCFYSEESDVVIFFQKEKITSDEIEEYLDEMGVTYTLVSFDPSLSTFPKAKDELSEVWFAREKYVLEEAIDDSLNKGIRKCIFYPNELTRLSLGYRANSQGREYCEIEGRLCRGTLVFEDKMVFLVCQGEERNITIEQAKIILKDKGIKAEVHNKGR